MGIFEGDVAIRGFYENWIGSYADFEMEAEEIRDLGNGVTFAVIVQNARPIGSTGHVRLRYAGVSIWEGVAVYTTNYTDIDEARAAAERLAEERGVGGPGPRALDLRGLGERRLQLHGMGTSRDRIRVARRPVARHLDRASRDGRVVARVRERLAGLADRGGRVPRA